MMNGSNTSTCESEINWFVPVGSYCALVNEEVDWHLRVNASLIQVIASEGARVGNDKYECETVNGRTSLPYSVIFSLATRLQC